MAIFVSLLQSPKQCYQSMQDAVKRISELYTKADSSVSDSDSSDSTEPYDAEHFFWLLRGLLFGIVRKIPFNHPTRELLIDFLVRLCQKSIEIATV